MSDILPNRLLWLLSCDDCRLGERGKGSFLRANCLPVEDSLPGNFKLQNVFDFLLRNDGSSSQLTQPPTPHLPWTWWWGKERQRPATERYQTKACFCLSRDLRAAGWLRGQEGSLWQWPGTVTKAEEWNENTWALVIEGMEVKFHSGLACSSSGKTGTFSWAWFPICKRRLEIVTLPVVLRGRHNLEQVWTNFSVKGQIINVLGFAGHMASVPTQLCLCSEKAARDNG